MATPFKFLSMDEFESLTLEDKRAYIADATAEVERTRTDHLEGGWHRLFRQDQEQTQQQQQPRPKEDKKPD